MEEYRPEPPVSSPEDERSGSEPVPYNPVQPVYGEHPLTPGMPSTFNVGSVPPSYRYTPVPGYGSVRPPQMDLPVGFVRRRMKRRRGCRRNSRFRLLPAVR